MWPFSASSDRILSTAKIMTICTILELVLATVGARWGGLAGLSLGWIAAIFVEAVFMFREVYKIAYPFSSSHVLYVKDIYKKL